jgi:hypothetical protein
MALNDGLEGSYDNICGWKEIREETGEVNSIA